MEIHRLHAQRIESMAQQQALVGSIDVRTPHRRCVKRVANRQCRHAKVYVIKARRAYDVIIINHDEGKLAPGFRHGECVVEPCTHSLWFWYGDVIQPADITISDGFLQRGEMPVCQRFQPNAPA